MTWTYFVTPISVLLSEGRGAVAPTEQGTLHKKHLVSISKRLLIELVSDGDQTLR